MPAQRGPGSGRRTRTEGSHRQTRPQAPQRSSCDLSTRRINILHASTSPSAWSISRLFEAVSGSQIRNFLDLTNISLVYGTRFRYTTALEVGILRDNSSRVASLDRVVALYRTDSGRFLMDLSLTAALVTRKRSSSARLSEARYSESVTHYRREISRSDPLTANSKLRMAGTGPAVENPTPVNHIHA